jgi:hypothetical protein
MAGVRWSEKQLAEHRRSQLSKAPPVPDKDEHGRNKLEARFAAEIGDALLHARLVRIVRFNCENLRIGEDCWYKPDFELVRAPQGEHSLPLFAGSAAAVLWAIATAGEHLGKLVYVETKGFWRDDARVKIKAVAARYPERLFVAATWDRREGWKLERIVSR